jgi:hypothetical protein
MVDAQLATRTSEAGQSPLSERAEHHGRGATAAVADADRAVLCTLVTHGAEQRDDDARAGAAHGVPERHGAAEDVDLAQVQVEELPAARTSGP